MLPMRAPILAIHQKLSAHAAVYILAVDWGEEPRCTLEQIGVGEIRLRIAPCLPSDGQPGTACPQLCQKLIWLWQGLRFLCCRHR